MAGALLLPDEANYAGANSEAYNQTISLFDLRESIRHGRLVYHELTLKERSKELKKEGRKEIVQREIEKDPAVFLESLYFNGSKYNYFLADSGVFVKQMLQGTSHVVLGGDGKTMKKLLKRYDVAESSYTFKGYDRNNPDNTICIPPNSYRLKGIPWIRTIDDYLEGMEKSLADIAEKISTLHSVGSNDSGKEIASYADMALRLSMHLFGFSNAALKYRNGSAAMKAYSLGNTLTHAIRKIERQVK